MDDRHEGARTSGMLAGRRRIARAPLFALALLPLIAAHPALAEDAAGSGLVRIAPEAQGTAIVAVPALAPALAKAVTLPTGGVVVSGGATVTPGGASLTIDQSTATAIIDWSSFSIGNGGTVRFDNGAGATLNRVTGTTVSSIDGLLSATGSVYLINPNGVIIGKTGVVNTGGTFVASTLDTDDSVFATGADLHFAGPSTASVINYGKVGALGGDVVLVASTVTNSGSLTAPKGSVGLLAGQAVLLRDETLSDGKFAVLLGGSATKATNAGLIDAANAELRAEGGNVYALAGATGAVIRATGVSAQDGKVWLVADGGSVSVAGAISARSAGGGGFVETSGNTVQIGAATIDAGQGGNWLLDPYNLKINQAAATTISGALNAGTNVTQKTTGSTTGAPGDIVVNPNVAITWSTAAALTLSSYHDVTIGAGAQIRSTGGGAVTLIADSTGTGSGTVNFGARSLIGTGGAVDIFYNPASYTGATSSTTAGNPYSAFVTSPKLTAYMLVNSVADLQAVNGSTAGIYALTRDLDLGGLSFSNALITTPFSGIFNGQNHAIDNLFIGSYGAHAPGYGMFLRNLGLIENLNLVNAAIRIGGIAGSAAGLLTGVNNGEILNVSATGAIDSNGVSHVGGLVGSQAHSGAIIDSSASAVISIGTSGDAGGLVGYNAGAILRSHASGSVTGFGADTILGGLVGDNVSGAAIDDSYAMGSASAVVYIPGNAVLLGGFVGRNAGTIGTSYTLAATNLTVEDGSDVASYEMGAFAGRQDSGGSITASYATGSRNVDNRLSQGQPTVSSGFAGTNQGAISGSYYDMSTTGLAAGVTPGATGLTTAQFSTASNFTGFTFSTTPGAAGAWVIIDELGSLNNANGASGATRPVLASEYSTTITNAHQLQLMAMNAAGHYILGADVNAANTTYSGSDIWIGNRGFVPIGSNANTASAFTGSLDGLGHVISNVTINQSPLRYVGLFGYVDAAGTISNLTLANEYVDSAFSTTSTDAGGLAGYSAGAISNIHASGSVNSSVYAYPAYVNGGYVDIPAYGRIGGLVGELAGSLQNSSTTATIVGTGSGPDAYMFAGGLAGTSSGTITGSHASGSTSATGSLGIAGGLVGSNQGMITTSYATGSVSASGIGAGGLIGRNDGAVDNSWADATVSAGGTSALAGGLIADNGGTVAYDYALGAVGVTGDGSSAGGLIGRSAGTVSYAYATGAVTGSGQNPSLGGLIGTADNSLTLSTARWDSATTGQASATGNVSAATMTNVVSLGGAGPDPLAMASYAGFSFTSTPGTLDAWVIVDQDGTLNGSNGATRPMLATEYATSIATSHQLQLIAMQPTAAYVLANDIDLSGTARAADLWGGTAGGGFVPLYLNRSFDGQGHVLTGLTIKRPGQSAALFSKLSVLGSIRNLVVQGAAITGGQYSGAIVGQNFGVVQNVTASGGFVTGTADTGGVAGSNRGSLAGVTNAALAVTGTTDVGGVAGLNTGTILSASADAGVTGMLRVGGLVGTTKSGSIGGSASSGVVNGVSYVGGLVGEAYGGSVTDSSSAAFVMATGDDAGGLIGANFGSVARSTSSSSVTGHFYVGGIAGFNAAIGTIDLGGGAGAQTIIGDSDVGGMIGWNAGSVTNLVGAVPTFTANVTGTGDATGGLVGYNSGSIFSGVQVSGTVSGNRYVGGVIGRNDATAATITNAASSAMVNGATVVGGLIGFNRGAVTGSSASGTVTATGAFAGGLIGTNSGALTNDMASGNVSGSDYVGGLVGANTGTVSGSTASGTVTSPGRHKGPKYGSAGGAN